MNNFLLQFEEENMEKRGNHAVGWEIRFLERERERYFSLDFLPFGLSVPDGARRKVVLRGEGYACTPIWWSSDNSKRKGSSPTCVIRWLRAM